MQDIYNPETDQTSLIMKESFYGITLVPKKYHPYVFEDKRCYKRIPIFYKNKIYFVDPEELIFGIQQTHLDKKIATIMYN